MRFCRASTSRLLGMPSLERALLRRSSKAFSIFSMVSPVRDLTRSLISSTRFSEMSRVLPSRSRPTSTSVSNSLLPSSSARAKAPSPANQIWWVYLRKSRVPPVSTLIGLCLSILSSPGSCSGFWSVCLRLAIECLQANNSTSQCSAAQRARKVSQIKQQNQRNDVTRESVGGKHADGAKFCQTMLQRGSEIAFVIIVIAQRPAAGQQADAAAGNIAGTIPDHVGFAGQRLHQALPKAFLQQLGTVPQAHVNTLLDLRADAVLERHVDDDKGQGRGQRRSGKQQAKQFGYGQRHGTLPVSHASSGDAEHHQQLEKARHGTEYTTDQNKDPLILLERRTQQVLELGRRQLLHPVAEYLFDDHSAFLVEHRILERVQRQINRLLFHRAL